MREQRITKSRFSVIAPCRRLSPADGDISGIGNDSVYLSPFVYASPLCSSFTVTPAPSTKALMFTQNIPKSGLSLFICCDISISAKMEGLLGPALGKLPTGWWKMRCFLVPDVTYSFRWLLIHGPKLPRMSHCRSFKLKFRIPVLL